MQFTVLPGCRGSIFDFCRALTFSVGDNRHLSALTKYRCELPSHTRFAVLYYICSLIIGSRVKEQPIILYGIVFFPPAFFMLPFSLLRKSIKDEKFPNTILYHTNTTEEKIQEGFHYSLLLHDEDLHHTCYDEQHDD